MFLDNQQLCVLKHIDMKVVPVYADFYVGLTPCKKAVSIQYTGKIIFKNNADVVKFIEDKNNAFSIECFFPELGKEKYKLCRVKFNKFSEKYYTYTANDIIQNKRGEQ